MPASLILFTFVIAGRVTIAMAEINRQKSLLIYYKSSFLLDLCGQKRYFIKEYLTVESAV